MVQILSPWLISTDQPECGIGKRSIQLAPAHVYQLSHSPPIILHLVIPFAHLDLSSNTASSGSCPDPQSRSFSLFFTVLCVLASELSLEFVIIHLQLLINLYHTHQNVSARKTETVSVLLSIIFPVSSTMPGTKKGLNKYVLN